MEKRNGYTRFPTISCLSLTEQNKYIFDNINVLDLVKEIRSLKLSVQVLEQRISDLENNEKRPTKTEQNQVEDTQDLTSTKKQDGELSVGDIINLGKYDGKDIEWQVLAQKDKSYLLISKNGLFRKRYNETRKRVTWKTCTLREYLNNEFYKKYFSHEEQLKIETTNNNGVNDKLFLLSMEEIKKYFNSGDDRKAVYNDGSSCLYWLRSKGIYSDDAPRVIENGTIYESGYGVDDGYIGVRPVLWINTDINKKKTDIEQNASNTSVGSIIKFGRYEGEEVDWQVLDINKEDNSVLLISKYILFKKAYNNKRTGSMWETSTLRQYLNNEFYSNTFNEEEKGKIKVALVKNSDNVSCKTKGGNDTEDKVFLLSIDEVEKYFNSSEERKASFANGYLDCFWLRSSGYSCDYAACIIDGGFMSSMGIDVTNPQGVRPLIWVKL